MSSSATIRDSNVGNHTTGSGIAGILTSLAAAQETTPDMVGENGDACHSHLGTFSDDLKQLASDTLAFKQALVGNDLPHIRSVITEHWPKVTRMLSALSEEERRTQIKLLFKLCFFSRAIRCQGNRSRTQFLELFKQLRTTFLKEAISVIPLIPHYGCFQDVDKLIHYYQAMNDHEIVRPLVEFYAETLASDFSTIFGKDFRSTPIRELLAHVVPINKAFVDKTPEQVMAYCKDHNIKNLSQACKWMKREGKKNSGHRKLIIEELFLDTTSGNINMAHKLMRHCTAFGSKLLFVVEQFMTSKNWSMIDPKFVPSVATTKHRLAFLNKTASGEERSSEPGRVACGENFFKAILDGKVNGAQSDLKKLADLIWEKGCFNHYGWGSRKSTSTLTDVERRLINAQWKKMVEFVRQLVADKYAKDLAERQARIDAGETDVPPVQDPRAVIPVVDTSGSMSSAGVMHYAIAMGIVCASISIIPGKLITFSQTPEVFRFDPNEDIFSLVRKIKNCAWGMNTNLDATYKLLLSEMREARSRGVDISSDFRLAIFTDGQFDQMVTYSKRGRDHYGGDRLSGFDTFQKRQEKAFTDAGFGVPLVVYWNMANRKVGFPAQSDTTGVLLVAGFSQTVMVEVMSGDYSLTVDEETGAVKVNVTPLDSFLKTMNSEDFEPVDLTLDGFWGIQDQRSTTVGSWLTPNLVVDSQPHGWEEPPATPTPLDVEIAELEARLARAKLARAQQEGAFS